MARSHNSRRDVGIWMDSPDRYGLISRVLHWFIAYMLIWQFATILTWRIFGPAGWVKFVTSFGPYHGTVGLLVLPLVVLRALWMLINRRRRPPHEMGWAGRAALAGHVTLYLLMFAIPALALLRAYGSGKGWLPWIPATGEEVAWLTGPANALHGPLSWCLSVLIVGHILAALFHRFIRKDGILARMVGPLRSRAMGCRTSSIKPKETGNAA
ncbi:cytochrome b [Brucella pseudogrignonensis]|uniref:cytochrome b n=1 Tax=Brucella pseudogrignonensis TaxID=419475 RepID=UPI001E43B768|nr:cytochrome b [Brucella pseudogrignonensis]MCD4512139.1 cytochrome b [Brucella pseudogrignonensis]